MRQQEVEWAVQEVREALKNAGWMPPHSFALRNPDESREERSIRRFRKDSQRTYEPTLGDIKRFSREDIIRWQQEGFYHQDDWRNELPGHERYASELLENLVRRAVRLNFVEVIDIRTDFADIGHSILQRFVTIRIGDEGYSKGKYYQWQAEYRDVEDNAVAEDIRAHGFEPDHWYLQCQGKGYHLELLHTDSTGNIDQQIRWSQNPYIVHIAEIWLLMLYHRREIPREEWWSFGRGYLPLRSRTSDDLPDEGLFLAPPWLERFIKAGYY